MGGTRRAEGPEGCSLVVSVPRFHLRQHKARTVFRSYHLSHWDCRLGGWEDGVRPADLTLLSPSGWLQNQSHRRFRSKWRSCLKPLAIRHIPRGLSWKNDTGTATLKPHVFSRASTVVSAGESRRAWQSSQSCDLQPTPRVLHKTSYQVTTHAAIRKTGLP